MTTRILTGAALAVALGLTLAAADVGCSTGSNVASVEGQPQQAPPTANPLPRPPDPHPIPQPRPGPTYTGDPGPPRPPGPPPPR
jgi:hypothetical protein